MKSFLFLLVLLFAAGCCCKEIPLIEPADNASISFVSQAQKAFTIDKNRTADFTFPRTVPFTYQYDGTAEVQISTDKNFSNPQIFTGGKTVQISNLVPGQKYYWRAVDGTNNSSIRTFTVAKDHPRWLNVPKVTNFRDLGGLKTIDGKMIRYNMLFRGGQFEKWHKQHPSMITPEGQKIFLETLKIQTEIDLRNNGTKIIPVPNYQRVGLIAYSRIFTPKYMERIKQIFDILAKQENYPVYFHCQGGADRTGTLAFLIEAMLGLKYNDLAANYELSNYSISGKRFRTAPRWQEFVKGFEKFAPGKSINEQVAAYLSQCGVTDDAQQHLKKLLLK